jgi:hypothetical protein
MGCKVTTVVPCVTNNLKLSHTCLLDVFSVGKSGSTSCGDTAGKTKRLQELMIASSIGGWQQEVD